MSSIQENNFWNNVSVGTPEQCWEWLAARNPAGYGIAWNGEKTVLAHRYSYHIVNGIIPDGYHILHRCDNPSCVNPNHLKLGTDADNAADKVSRNRQYKGEDNHLSKLKEYNIVDIRNDWASGKYTQIQLSEKYNIHQSVISRIITRKIWKHVM